MSEVGKGKGKGREVRPIGEYGRRRSSFSFPDSLQRKIRAQPYLALDLQYCVLVGLPAVPKKE